MPNSVRIDKWLWAVRLYKSRSQATTACQAGRVKVDDQSVKPSKGIESGQTITVRKKNIVYTYQVESLIEKRVGAAQAQECYTDLTPEEEKAKARIKPQDSVFYQTGATRARGAGRPTKKERRDMDRWKGKG
jgi:ribosome-associated heat shock protein Hsp15